jgi:quinol monooxygenase YgiN
MTTIVLLDIPATDTTRDGVLNCLQEALSTTRAFEGCEGLELLVNQDDGANILVYERWASREHYNAYRAFRAETGFSASFRAMFPNPPTVRVFDIDRRYP